MALFKAMATGTLVTLGASAFMAEYHVPAYLVLAPVAGAIVAWLAFGRHGIAVFWRVLLPLVIGVAMVEAYRWSHGNQWLKANVWSIPINGNTAEQFFAVMATLYAVTTALVLVKAIESFDLLFKAMSRETDKIRSISDFLFYMQATIGNGEPIHRLRCIFRDYLKATFENPKRTDGAGDSTFANCVGLIARLECADENDRIALAEIMKSMNELSAVRAERIVLTNYRVPGYLVIMLAVMSLSMILMFFVDPAEKISHNYTIIFLLSVFSAFILLLLLDIADPFDGFWEMDVSTYDMTRRYIDGQLAMDASGGNGEMPPAWMTSGPETLSGQSAEGQHQ
ncbi:MAG: DUF4239 domain-containing protein [Hyphomicrobiaceae bacterium]